MNAALNPSVEKNILQKTQDLSQIVEFKDMKFSESSLNNKPIHNNLNSHLNSNSNTLNKYFKSIATSKGQTHKKKSASMY